MNLRLKPLYFHAAALAIALAFTAGAPVASFVTGPAHAANTDEPAPAPVPAPAPSSSDTNQPTKKLKAKKKKKKKFKDDNDTSSLDHNLQAPSRPDLTLANSQIKAGQYRAAIITLNRLSRPEDANVLNLLGYSHRKLGLVDVGMRYYLAALERNPEHKGVHEYLGEAYLQKDDLEKAEIMLKKLGKICGTGCEPYRELAAAIADYKTKHAL
ncbi:MAG: hypothetical protein GY948_13655 [Alphaproteobacteria bacterium]|nr:hypothetical protein [Alphaproteobacteria bacterium]